MVGPDEPRYAAIGREMARSGDWVTPRLWGAPWFEKPALLYWLTGAAFRLGFGPDLAPRVFVAAMALAFLGLLWWVARREFNERTAWFAVFLLGASGLWMGYSQIGVTDLPLTVCFSSFMLLLLGWLGRGDERLLPVAAALLGAATLAKGLVPLALAGAAAPAILWAWRRGVVKWGALARPRVWLPFLLVALPWYALCYARNGSAFTNDFFLKHHFSRFLNNALQHGQPWWYYLPVLAGALLPWTPALLPAGWALRKPEPRRWFLALWIFCGLLLFSAAENKLPGYILPLVPAVALLAAVALDELRSAGPWLAACAALVAAFPIAARMLPAGLATGRFRARPGPNLNGCGWPRWRWQPRFGRWTGGAAAWPPWPPWPPPQPPGSRW